MILKKSLKKSVVLLSSGLDSTVNLLLAQKETKVILALSFDYGQVSAPKELSCSQEICKKYGVTHKIVDLSFIKEISQSSLHKVQDSRSEQGSQSVQVPCEQRDLPLGEAVDLDDPSQCEKTAESVWVSNRNGIFLNVAAGFAEALKANFVVPGFNKEEAQTFPDNSQDFLQSLNASFVFSTRNKVQVKCFTTNLNKSEIYKLGAKENLDFNSLWPCYQNGEKWCGQCESCKRFLRSAKQ